MKIENGQLVVDIKELVLGLKDEIDLLHVADTLVITDQVITKVVDRILSNEEDPSLRVARHRLVDKVSPLVISQLQADKVLLETTLKNLRCRQQGHDGLQQDYLLQKNLLANRDAKLKKLETVAETLTESIHMDVRNAGRLIFAVLEE